MLSDKLKLAFFTVGFTIFVAMLFSGSFVSNNVISTQQFPTVTGKDKVQAEPDYGDILGELKPIADKAIGALLNGSKDITPSQIKVNSATKEKFSSPALNCPKEGMMYSDVIVDGYKVILEANGKTYDYRLDNSDQVILCQ